MLEGDGVVELVGEGAPVSVGVSVASGVAVGVSVGGTTVTTSTVTCGGGSVGMGVGSPQATSAQIKAKRARWHAWGINRGMGFSAKSRVW